MKYKYVPPAIIRKIFSNFIWQTSNKKILLTFDDGPNPGTTEIILDELQNNNIKAAFFCVGNNIQKYKPLAEEILASGNIIANHTYNHKVVTNLSTSDFNNEISMFNNIAHELLGITPKYFRPPHGKFNLNTEKILKNYEMKNIMWSLLTYDYKNDLAIVQNSVKKYLKNNSIIVLHDSLKSKNIIRDSIKCIVDESLKKGFEIGDPDECLK